MYTKLSTYTLAIFCSFLLFWISPVQAVDTPDQSGVYTIEDIAAIIQGKSLILVISGDSVPAYTTYELFSPARLIIDLANAKIAQKIDIAAVLPKNNFTTLMVSTLKDKTPEITRFELTLTKGYTYKVGRIENDLSVRIVPGKGVASAPVATKQKKAVVSDPTLDALMDSSEAVVVDKTLHPEEDVTAAEAMEDSFGFSGYKSTRVSVDFYKIDLHNVFRLFRQISDINLIVDESVSGSLTLALNDVPWEFALDIILNLKNLKKEERFNTIVIYSDKNEFTWPQSSGDNLSFKPDVEVIEQEALIIKQSTNQSAELMQAKELLRQAKVEEKSNDAEDAALLYERAFTLWPDNAKISNRLAALYLVDLRMNAKAFYFAKETLKLDKTNYQAALYAAIASANMDQIPDAMEYFAQSISGTPPLKEALISYAAFSEEKGQPEVALKLLDRYTKDYTDTVNIMASRARLYDAIGQTQKATEQYKKLLYSGYQLVPGLKKYIRSRLSEDGTQVSQ